MKRQTDKTFSEALAALLNEKTDEIKNYLWNGDMMAVKLQKVDEHSKMMNSYLYIERYEGSTDITMRVPWLPSQLDIMSKAWAYKLKVKK